MFFCTSPETDLEYQFTHKDSIAKHEPCFEACYARYNPQCIESGSELLYKAFVIILDVLTPLKIILDKDSNKLFRFNWLDILLCSLYFSCNVNQPSLLLCCHYKQMSFNLLFPR